MSLRFSLEEARARGWIDTPTAAPRTGKRGKDRADREYEAQVALLDSFRLSYPELARLLIGIPNGGTRKHRFEGWRMRRAGARAGVSDLFLCVPVPPLHGLWLEMKAEPPHAAAVQDSQWLWLLDNQRQGYAGAVAYGTTAGERALDLYLSGNWPAPDNNHVLVFDPDGERACTPPERVLAELVGFAGG